MRHIRSLCVLVLAVLAVLLATPGHAEKRMSDEERGALLYDRHCVQCHGLEAAGDGPATAQLVAPVPDLRDAMTKANRYAHATAVLDGAGAMPGFSISFDRYDARRVVRHMERAARGELDEPDEESDDALEGDEEQADDEQADDEAGEEAGEAGEDEAEPSPEAGQD